MDDATVAARLHDLWEAANRLRLPGHRHTAEAALAAQDELRDGLRRLIRDLTGREPRRAKSTRP